MVGELICGEKEGPEVRSSNSIANFLQRWYEWRSWCCRWRRFLLCDKELKVLLTFGAWLYGTSTNPSVVGWSKSPFQMCCWGFQAVRFLKSLRSFVFFSWVSCLVALEVLVLRVLSLIPYVWIFFLGLGITSRMLVYFGVRACLWSCSLDVKRVLMVVDGILHEGLFLWLGKHWVWELGNFLVSLGCWTCLVSGRHFSCSMVKS